MLALYVNISRVVTLSLSPAPPNTMCWQHTISVQGPLAMGMDYPLWYTLQPLRSAVGQLHRSLWYNYIYVPSYLHSASRFSSSVGAVEAHLHLT